VEEEGRRWVAEVVRCGAVARRCAASGDLAVLTAELGRSFPLHMIAKEEGGGSRVGANGGEDSRKAKNKH
jgi:hypothetical protein